MERVATANDALSGLPGYAYFRGRGSRRFQRRSDDRDGTLSGAVAARVRSSVDGGIIARAPIGGAGTVANVAVRSGCISGTRCVVRKLVDPTFGDVGRAAGSAGRGNGSNIA